MLNKDGTNLRNFEFGQISSRRKFRKELQQAGQVWTINTCSLKLVNRHCPPYIFFPKTPI